MGDAVTARLAADAARQHSDAYEDAESAVRACVCHGAIELFTSASTLCCYCCGSPVSVDDSGVRTQAGRQ